MAGWSCWSWSCGGCRLSAVSSLQPNCEVFHNPRDYIQYEVPSSSSSSSTNCKGLAWPFTVVTLESIVPTVISIVSTVVSTVILSEFISIISTQVSPPDPAPRITPHPSPFTCTTAIPSAVPTPDPPPAHPSRCSSPIAASLRPALPESAGSRNDLCCATADVAEV